MQDDIDAFVDMVDEALLLAEPGRVNILYVGLSIGNPQLDEDMYRKWFNALQPYIDSGQVEWKTFSQMYDAYIQWEAQTQKQFQFQPQNRKPLWKGVLKITEYNFLILI